MLNSTNSMSQVIFPLNQNPYQNIGQADVRGFSNNLRYCDVGLTTAAEFNAKIASSEEITRRTVDPRASDGEDALFGTHLREAVSTVRKLFSR